MKQLASVFVIAASALVLGACSGSDPLDPLGGGNSDDGGGSSEGGAGGMSSGDASGGAGSGGNGEGGAAPNACPRARIETPGEVLNVRPDPSTANTPVGTLVDGDLVDVIAQVQGESVEGNDVWFNIEKGALTGYISAVFASCTTDLPPEPIDGYYAPLACGSSALITQGNNGDTSHNGATSQYAFDLAVGLNTEIHAMADGTVGFIYDATGPGDNCYNGGGSECGPYANYVVLRHADNTMTAVKHLNTVLVAVDDVVLQGDVIGLSGTTGWSTGPHVHVVREENCGSASCTSIPLSFADFPSNGGVPQTGDTITSGNCP
jgi:hypothetical protein